MKDNRKPGWTGIKEYRDMRALWGRLDRPDQKIWIDFMERIVEEWGLSEWANFFIGFVFGACVLAACLLLGGRA